MDKYGYFDSEIGFIGSEFVFDVAFTLAIALVALTMIYYFILVLISIF